MPAMLFLLVVSVFVALSATADQSHKALYSVPSVNWEPYWIVEEGEAVGILGVLMREIDKAMRISLVPAEPYPVKRNQYLFDKGELVVECCVNEAWRKATDDGGTTLWSDIVLSTHELVVTHPNSEYQIKQGEDLRGLAIATILGYGYPLDSIFQRFDVPNNVTQLSLVANQRVDGAIIDEYEYRYVIRQNAEVAKFASQLKPHARIGSSDLKMRIHSSRPDLVRPLNEAIAKLRETGRIEALIEAYTL